MSKLFSRFSAWLIADGECPIKLTALNGGEWKVTASHYYNELICCCFLGCSLGPCRELSVQFRLELIYNFFSVPRGSNADRHVWPVPITQVGDYYEDWAFSLGPKQAMHRWRRQLEQTWWRVLIAGKVTLCGTRVLPDYLEFPYYWHFLCTETAYFVNSYKSGGGGICLCIYFFCSCTVWVLHFFTVLLRCSRWINAIVNTQIISSRLFDAAVKLPLLKCMNSFNKQSLKSFGKF